jgi:LEA14-like dessication related protein
LDTLDFNSYFDYKNNSDIDIKLSEQEYDIYVNEVYITTLRNYQENILKANSVSELGFNINLNLPDLDKKLKVNYFKMIAEPKAVKIRVEMKWKVRFGLFKIPIKYSWNTNLKEILGWYLPMYKK